MALDDRERRLLAELEQHTVREDPALAGRFARAQWRAPRMLPVSHLVLLVLALGVLTGVHVVVPDMHALLTAALTVLVAGSWLLLAARATPPTRPRQRPGRRRASREGRPPDAGTGGPPACV